MFETAIINAYKFQRIRDARKNSFYSFFKAIQTDLKIHVKCHFESNPMEIELLQRTENALCSQIPSRLAQPTQTIEML